MLDVACADPISLPLIDLPVLPVHEFMQRVGVVDEELSWAMEAARRRSATLDLSPVAGESLMRGFAVPVVVHGRSALFPVLPGTHSLAESGRLPSPVPPPPSFDCFPLSLSDRLLPASS